MPDIGRVVMSETTRNPKSPSLLTKIGGLQFLLGQFLTIFATILGVYLAGYVGFQRTLEYDRYTKAQQQADLLTGMGEELRQNLDRLRKFYGRLPNKMAENESGMIIRTDAVRLDEWPRLRLYIWQAAGRSNSLFDTPPHVLTDVQAFYEDIGEMFSDEFARDTFGYLWNSHAELYADKYKMRDRTGGANAFFGKYKARLDEKLKYAETTILPAINKSIAEAQQTAEKYSK